MNIIRDDFEDDIEKTYDVISKNVVKYRKLKGVSQFDLALDIGLTGNAFIARAENRTKNQHFNIEHLVKISKILNIEICEFFKEKNDNL